MSDFQNTNTLQPHLKNDQEQVRYHRDWIFVAITIFFLGFSTVDVRAWIVSQQDIPVYDYPEIAVHEGGDITIVPPPLPVPVANEDARQAPTSTISGSIVLVQDVESGTVLYEKNAEAVWPIASITKLMAALALLEKNIDLHATSTAIGIDVYDTLVFEHEVYSNDDLFSAMLIGSSNRSVMTLASSTGGIFNLVDTMNTLARRFGMHDTHFVEVTGLNRKNISTAKDVTKLLSEALSHDVIVDALTERDFTITDILGEHEKHMYNTDWLVLGWIPHSLDHIIGGKTGHIPDSGFNFAMEVADEHDNRLHVVVFGSDTHQTRFEEARDLSVWAFDNYTWPQKNNTPTDTIE